MSSLQRWLMMERRESFRDPNRAKLLNLLNHYWHQIETTPERSKGIAEQGIGLAQQLNDSCWLLYWEHLFCSIFVYYIKDYDQAMKLAVKLTVKAHKPELSACPAQSVAKQSLLDVYTAVDPRSYADEIQQIIEFFEQHHTNDFGLQNIAKVRRVELAFGLSDFDLAIENGQKYLAHGSRSKDITAVAHGKLAWAYYIKGNLSQAVDHINIGVEDAMRSFRGQSIQATCHAIRAAVLRRLGQTDDAEQSYTIALMQQRQIKMPPYDETYHDGIAAYLELDGQIEKVWQLREEQLNDVIGTGELHQEALIRLHRATLLGRMGQSHQSELNALRQLLPKFRNPNAYDAEIGQIEVGDFGELFLP